MAWVMVDDAILDNPKILQAGTQGLLFHVAAITWCGRNLSDGFIPKVRARQLLDVTDLPVDPDTTIARLADAGLWHDCGSKWQIHDYLKYNPTRAQVLKRRERLHQVRAAAGRQGGKKSGQSRRSKRGSKSEATVKQTTKQNEAPLPEVEELSLSSRANNAHSVPAPAAPVECVLERRQIPEAITLTPDMRRRIEAVGCRAPAKEFDLWVLEAKAKRRYAYDWPGLEWDRWVARHGRFGCAGDARGVQGTRGDRQQQPTRPRSPTATETREYLRNLGIMPRLKDVPG